MYYHIVKPPAVSLLTALVHAMVYSECKAKTQKLEPRKPKEGCDTYKMTTVQGGLKLYAKDNRIIHFLAIINCLEGFYEGCSGSHTPSKTTSIAQNHCKKTRQSMIKKLARVFLPSHYRSAKQMAQKLFSAANTG